MQKKQRSLTGFLRVSSRVSFHALRGGHETVMEGCWLGEERGLRDDVGSGVGGAGYLHGLILAVGAQVDCRAVCEQDDDAVLPGIVLWWRHACAGHNGTKHHWGKSTVSSLIQTQSALSK